MPVHSLGALAAALLLAAATAVAPVTPDAEVDPLAPARRLLDEGRFPEAEQAALATLATLHARGRAESLDGAAARDLVVEARWRVERGGDEDTLRLAREALSLKEALLAPSDAGVVASVNNLGVVRELLGDYAEARALYERALAMQTSALGPDDPALARTLTNLGILTRTTGDLEAAERHFGRALEIRETSLPPGDARVGFAHLNVASVQWEAGDHAGSRRSAGRAVAILEDALGPADLRTADAVEALGASLNAAGDLEDARALFERALAIRTAALGPEDVLLAWSLVNVGDVLAGLGDPVAAQAHLERALALYERALGPDSPHVAGALHDLAVARADAGDLAAAEPLFARAVATWRRVSPAHPRAGRALHSWGVRQLRAGRTGEAERQLREALAVRETALGPDHPQVAETRAALGVVAAEAGRDGEAFAEATRADRLLRGHLRLTARALPERSALAFADGRASIATLPNALVGTNPAAARDAWDAVVRGRALVLDEMAARQGAAVSREALGPLAVELARARARLASLVVRPDVDDAGRYRALVREARSRKERLEAELAERSVAFREEQDRQVLGLADVATALPADAALLAFVRTDASAWLGGRALPEGHWARPRYVAFVLRGPGEDPVAVPLGSAEEIDALVARWRQRVREESARARPSRRSEVETARVGAALRRLLLDPVWPRVAGARRLFVVPDGPLHLLNLAALPLRDGRYLIEGGPVLHVLSAERDLVPSATPVGRGLLALGAPAFDAPSRRPGPDARLSARRGVDCGALRSLRFDPLPASGREARSVAEGWDRRLGEVALLDGDDASEANLRRGAPGRRVVHLATHGFFLDDASCGYGPMGSRSAHPLLRSGLALAGVHRRPSPADDDDGILTAEEVGSLDLRGVEWAVLSACDTGLGDVQAGEGVLGLRRAFQVGGVRTVIMSLWPVDDEQARRFMASLYRARFAGGADTATAVHRATLSALEARRRAGAPAHPFDWAGFVAAGDWR
jgi:CHAT domain-containing protein/tetratricopeptide (TPR) repeat protein